MGNFDQSSKEFEVDHIYYQWLNFRKPFPVKLDKIVMKIFWIFVIVLIVTGLNIMAMQLYVEKTGMYISWELENLFNGVYTVDWMCIFFFLLFSFLFFPIADFLFHLPRVIREDTDYNIIDGIAVSPVPTSEIVSDLRRWIIRLNFRHMMPAFILLFVVVLALLTLSAWEMGISGVIKITGELFVSALPVLVILICLWTFALYTGLMMSALPGWFTTTGAFVLLWLVPVLFYILIFGYLELKWFNSIMEQHLYFLEGFFPYMFYETEWLIPTAFFALQSIVPTVVAASILPRLFEKRRSGVWR